MKRQTIARTLLAVSFLAMVVTTAGAVLHVGHKVATDLACIEPAATNVQEPATMAPELSGSSVDPCDPWGLDALAIARAGATGGIPGLCEPTLAPPEPPQLPPAGEVLTVRVEAEQVVATERVLPD